MTDKQNLLKAAKIIASRYRGFSCVVLECEAGGSILASNYSDAMGVHPLLSAFHGEGHKYSYDDQRLARTLALLLYREILCDTK